MFFRAKSIITDVHHTQLKKTTNHQSPKTIIRNIFDFYITGGKESLSFFQPEIILDVQKTPSQYLLTNFYAKLHSHSGMKSVSFVKGNRHQLLCKSFSKWFIYAARNRTSALIKIEVMSSEKCDCSGRSSAGSRREKMSYNANFLQTPINPCSRDFVFKGFLFHLQLYWLNCMSSSQDFSVQQHSG